MGLAETYLILNAVTQGAFRTNPIEFLLSPKGMDKIGADGTWTVSLPEIIMKGTSGRAYAGVKTDTLAEVIKANLGLSALSSGNRNMEWVKVAGQMVLIPIGFKLGKKLARPALTKTRRLLKDVGLQGTVTV